MSLYFEAQARRLPFHAFGPSKQLFTRHATLPTHDFDFGPAF
jgi:hypothetical protein